MNAHTTTARRTALFAAGLGLTALALSGCAYFGPLHETSDSATVDDATTAGVDRIRLDRLDGTVSITGDPSATGISIERTVRYWGQERTIGDTHRVEGSELVLGGCGPRCIVSYTVTAPADIDVGGNTDNGGIDLEAVRDVDLETDNGRITVRTAEDVRLETDNGRVELTDVSGDIVVHGDNGLVQGKGLAGSRTEVETDNGRIELDFETAQDVHATTSNGQIILTVPAGSFRVDAQTDNGSVRSQVADDPSGEHELVLRADNGSIDVRQR
ncbi:hypothetical protein ET445_02735 [Agromyces protaetiae]|uniref:DUF4097 domain-containing protein n=1 Tax=Agromyces protaetiae TaxID=2509455 RepID=A0A4P6FA17_9MICO|nr:DUF4097 family beta strand repeat-containing protein [Agromyces protaetiae]QAY72416.1 hypothetical protein ET445_02735 [Agromyces protaetiae]